MSKLTLGRTLKLSTIIGILAVSGSVFYHLAVRPELTQRRSERLFRECLGATVDLEGSPTQEEHEWLVELCVKSGGVKELAKFKRGMDTNPRGN